MNKQSFSWPYDPTGSSPENLVVGEVHTLSPANGSSFRFIVPKASPYFRRSMKVKHLASGKELTQGVDWVPGHRFDAASSTAPFLEIFGSVLILNNDLSGSFVLEEYHTLGGEFVLDETKLLTILSNAQVDPRSTTWDAIVNPPGNFDPLAHTHSVQNSMGYDAMVAELQKLVTTFSLEKSEILAALADHTGDKSNPHSVTLDKLNIGRLSDLQRATLEQILNVAEGNLYVTAKELGTCRSSARAARNRSAHVDADGLMCIGNKIALTTGQNNSQTVLGYIAVQSDRMGFMKANGTDWYGWFDAQGKFQHYGMTYNSDPALKENLVQIGHNYRTGPIQLMRWTWRKHKDVPEDMWGKPAYGIDARAVQKVYPHLVHKDCNGNLAVDYEILSLSLVLDPPRVSLWEKFKAFVKYTFL